MFGCIPAGRPVQFSPSQVGEGKYMFAIEDAASVNHLVIFLLPNMNLPPNFGGAIYFSWPPYKEFKMLGFISNEKPSAIFRMGGLGNKENKSQFDGNTIEVDMEGSEGGTVILQLGISIEPISQIQQQMPSKEPSNALVVSSGPNVVFPPLTPNEMVNFAQKIMENLFNFALSFERTPGFPNAVAAIPTEVLKKWYTNFESRIKKDPFFWKEN
eukprot:TRINITY_DN17258_c0_g1_i1.p1 TRINITY_DN17258_c0_g1~~TRINITY_DN17258_c0_g1_i1.p1  ORF type:complete len:213 (-),score=45.76 TRINITY_DN17258_c0_g1_i1:49-687(-)